MPEYHLFDSCIYYTKVVGSIIELNFGEDLSSYFVDRLDFIGY